MAPERWGGSTCGESMNEQQPVAVPLRVWDLPLRIVHWAMVVLLIALVVTAKIGGSAMDWHMRAGEAMLSLVLFRILWGFLGSHHARFSSFIRGPRAVIAYTRSLLRPPHAPFAGHNPLGGWMVVLLLVALLVQATAGLFANDDIATEGPLARFISKDLSDAISTFHSRDAWFVIALASVHVAATLFYLIRFQENLIQPMLDGIKHVPRALTTGANDSASPARALALLALCVLAVWLLVTRRWVF
jgi:cytochrome b